MQSRTSGLKRESWRKYNKKSSQMDRQNPARLLLVHFVSVLLLLLLLLFSLFFRWFAIFLLMTGVVSFITNVFRLFDLGR